MPSRGSVRWGRSAQIARILVTVSPRMYREALALSVHERRPDLEVRIAPPEEVSAEVASFEPHLLVRNDDDGIDPRSLEDVLCWIEIVYSDHMGANISVDGRASRVSDISMDDLFVVIDETTELISDTS